MSKTKTANPDAEAQVDVLAQEVPGFEPDDEPLPRIGRPSVLETLGLSLDQIVSCYRNSTSERDAAAKLGFTVRTLRKYLHAANVFPGDENKTKPRGKSYHPSAVYHWIRSRNGIVPRSVPEIAVLSGIKPATIRKFLTRRREAAEAHLATLGLIRELENVQLVSVRGQRVMSQQIGQTTLKVDLYDLSVQIDCLLRSGVVVKCRLSYNEYCRLFEGRGDDLALRPGATRSSDPRGSTL